MFRALRHRNYRLYFLGQIISLSGSWLQTVAQGWLVFELTHSPFWLGFVGFLNFLPLTFFSLIGGSIADRLPKHRILLALQIPPMLLAFIFAGMIWSHTITAGWIGVLAFGFGLINAFDIPTRQAFAIELVGKEDLANALALNSATFNTARLLGPAVGGVIIATLGAGWCLFINGVSYVAAIWALVAMRLEKEPPRKSGPALLGNSIREILLYVRRTPRVYSLLMLVSIMTIFGWSFWILIPAFADQVLGGSAVELGKLMSAGGVGALGSALFVAAFNHRVSPRRLLMAGVLIFVAGVAVFAMSTNFYLSLAMMAVAGFGIILFYINANTTLQKRVPNHLRGRMMGVYAFSFGGLSPLGNLLIGLLAEKAGPPAAVITGAAVCALMAYVVFRLTPMPPMSKFFHDKRNGNFAPA
ncbi:MAG: Enterobactin exporter EntS [bacterium]|nr:Enterobactin exporter EntS [bacterium]